MTDRETFLKAIIANPADDEPRLVYADWLEERGDPLGEFVRVQVELAKSSWLLADGTIAGAGSDYEQMLRRRERELFTNNYRGWADEFRGRTAFGGHLIVVCGDSSVLVDAITAPTNAALKVEFRRGFPAIVKLRGVDWWGGTCERCEGTGDCVCRRESPGPDHCQHCCQDDSDGTCRPTGLCAACSGTGRTPGLGPRLVKVAPIERVEISDKGPGLIRVIDSEPNPPVSKTVWAWSRIENVATGTRGNLPPDIFGLLGGEIPDRRWPGLPEPADIRFFDSESAALDALQQGPDGAALRWARGETPGPKRGARST